MLRVHGYALPWNSPAYVEGIVETVAPRAVDAASPRNVTLAFGDHDVAGRPVYAQTRDGTLKLFSDDFGLGFTAMVARGDGMRRAIASGAVDQCSVNFVSMSRNADGRVQWAAIDHVALVTAGAYTDTGCWLADDPPARLPPHLRAMAEQHLQTRMARSELGRAPGRASAGVAGPHARHPGRLQVPPSVNILLDDPDWNRFWAQQRQERNRLDEIERHDAIRAGRSIPAARFI